MADKVKRINWYYVAAIGLLLGFIFINFYNSNQQSKVVMEYKEGLTPEEIEEMKVVAEEYNSSYSESLGIDDIYDETTDLKSSVNLFNSDDPIGSVEIPSLDVEMPIYEGTSEKELQIGAGHLEGSSMPTGGQSNRSVITAHRGLTTKKMFRDIDKLGNGDVFIIDSFGERKAYEVYDKEVILPEDTNSVDVIVGEDIVTLLTCDPYMVNTHRLLVNGKRIEYNSGIERQDKKSITFSLIDAEYIILIIIAVIASLKTIHLLYKKVSRIK